MRPSKVRSLPLCAALALILILPSPFGHIAKAAPAEAPVTVLSLAGLEAGQVRQCGIRVLSGSGADEVTLEIALERSGAATELVVRASGPGTAARISDVRVVPRTIRLDAMSGPFPAPHGTERRMSSSSSQVTAFIHELMLRGTHAVVATAQRDIEIEVPGPLSASVRAAYLNCAGDLYRPGE